MAASVTGGVNAVSYAKTAQRIAKRVMYVRNVCFFMIYHLPAAIW